MRRRERCMASLLVLVLVVPGAGAFAAPPPAQSSDAGGVTVKVTPRSLGADVPTWDFELILETHVRPLDEDIAAAARLIDSHGQPHAPLAWDGSPPGGHHRRGVLRFRPPADNPATVVLEIRDIGGVAVRSFRWRRD